jgi:hypothetical protein
LCEALAGRGHQFSGQTVDFRVLNAEGHV